MEVATATQAVPVVHLLGGKCLSTIGKTGRNPPTSISSTKVSSTIAGHFTGAAITASHKHATTFTMNFFSASFNYYGMMHDR